MKSVCNLLSAMAFLACILLAHPDPVSAAADEQHRIDLLLEAIGKQEDLAFIRNGTEHTAEEAVNHLTRKRRSAGNRITTAEAFIDRLATASSFSGKLYMIRQPGKNPEPAGPFLHRLLLEAAPKSS